MPRNIRLVAVPLSLERYDLDMPRVPFGVKIRRLSVQELREQAAHHGRTFQCRADGCGHVAIYVVKSAGRGSTELCEEHARKAAADYGLELPESL